MPTRRRPQTPTSSATQGLHAVKKNSTRRCYPDRFITQEVPAPCRLHRPPARPHPAKNHTQTVHHSCATQPARARPAKSRTHASLHPEQFKSCVTERGKGRGGRHACQVQRALRAWCLHQQPVVYVVELTSNELPPGPPGNLNFDWRDLLASMDPPVVRGLMEESEL